MYVVFYGTDRNKVRDKVTDYIESNLPKDATLTTIDGDSFSAGQVINALGAASLFGGREWMVFDSPSDNEEFVDELKKSLPELAESENTFIIIENNLLAADKKIYAKFAAEIIELKKPAGVSFNAFALAEALLNKDKKKLWVLLQEAKLNNLREEEIVGILWWQLKSLRLAAQTASASEAGMKDFPYNKTKKSLSKFSEGEVEKLAQSLLEVYHDGHAGVRDIDTALEKWVLSQV